ncbi:putative TonB-dependent receptor [Magnetospirillum sp. LM-5]|uniref:TonB-dependent copper receptor n=1 Tax=Magnetospirillum sp. LM-5 TaxID=2681466 RepID=UPI001384E589|nr:TonB-dependent copper receptor [Magnetospirillum sp. LM-5]CAA7617281.1 putative TonB-dependent receptor [Magnetospirillum sp. LM-5]
MTTSVRTRRARLCSGAALAALLAAAGPARAEEQAAPATLDEVIVTAPAMAEPMVIVTDPRNPRTPIPPADGAGYLKSIPGFNVVRQGAVDGDPVLRGQGGSRLDLLLDGAPLLGGCPNRMDPPTSYVFPNSFDKLTVLKGPQSVVHGGGALGTVLVEREAPRFTDWGIRGNASALYGSFDRNDEMVDAQAGAQQGFVRAIATHSSSDNYKDGNGSVLHSHYWRHSGTASVGWTPDKDTLLQITADKSQGQAAMPGKMMDATKLDREGLNIQASRANISPLVAKIKAQVFHNYVDHVMDTFSLRFNNGGMGTMSAASQVDHLMEGVKGSVELTPTAATKVTVGADYTHDQHSSRSLNNTEYRTGLDIDTKPRVKDLELDNYSMFGEVKHDLSGMSRLAGGLRASRIEATRNNFQPNLSDGRNLYSGFGRYEHDVDLGAPVTTFVNLGHIERAPDYWERQKVTASGRTFDMDSETTEQVDIGALFKQGPWRGSATLFYAYTDGYILVSSSMAKNVDARRVGGEGELAYQFMPNWTVEGAVAYTYGQNLTNDVPLAQTPPLDGSAAVKYDDGTFLGGLHLRAVASQSRIDKNWGSIMSTDIDKTAGFAVLSANIGWRPVDAMTLTGGIDNIFDKTYAEHISKTGSWSGGDLSMYNDNLRVNEPGRTFWMRGSLKF